ncbi:NAD-dependent epimerase/dehydratase family protein [Streptomyces radiopugnans]|uniref:Nucleoside-diphosphate-sugar epimerase n=1 Tax=Streptomyces radiopugnans TaxID=403935 RepID=A0A1H9GB81_9ACTN|nr:NAD(P)-dependent oxidoreductase [Streptomyces radiopugnans]SEQ47334.1 Nucleoside-diphosphate-sugar epimerase [Streptomyces radiopugnans]
MRYLVTGATGFVGTRLVRRLLEEGHTVAALVRDPARARLPAAVEPLGGDLADGRGLSRAAAWGADRVIHLAGAVRAAPGSGCGGYASVNAGGTRRLCRALAALPRPPRLVHCSSLAAAGPSPPGRPRREDDPPAPVSAYGRSKLAGEEELRAVSAAVPGTVVRPPIVYGPGDADFLPALLATVRGGVLPVCGFGPRRCSLIHVDDLCRVLLAAADRGSTVGPRPSSRGIYHAGDGTGHRWQDLAAAVAKLTGHRPPTTVPLPRPVAYAAAWGAETAARVRGRPSVLCRDKVRELARPAWICGHERAARELGFTPEVFWPAGLADALRTVPGAWPDRPGRPGTTPAPASAPERNQR